MWSSVLALLGLCLVSKLSAATTACGKQQVRNRIYGGTSAVQGEWPWHATLNFQGLPFCGATVISEQWLLTAAHCFNGDETLKDLSSWEAYLGFTRLGGELDPQTVVRGLAKILVHEKYTSFLNGYDVALLELAQPLAFTQLVQPVCVPLAGHHFRLRSTCWVTGLKDEEEGDNATSARPLQKVNITLIGRKTCNCIYNSYGLFELFNPALAGMICGTDKDGDRGPCSGDSGGPVVCNEDGVWFLAGVVSFSLGCHLPNSPTLFSEVSAYANWIQSKTAGPVSFANQTITVSAIPMDEENCTDFISTKNPGCGIPKLNTSGPGLQPGEWPWSVGLFFQDSYVCEGSLISESWVIAAGHCFVGPGVSDDPKDWTLSVGRPPQQVTLQKITIHGAYVTAAEGSDIAMLQLSQPVTFRDDLQPVCLPRSEHQFRFGSQCWVTGRRQGARGDTSQELQEAELDLIGPNKCNCIYSQPSSTGPRVSILPRMICAAPEQGMDSVCLNDTSGPLVCSEDGAWFLAGVGSYGGSCGHPARPGVYTEIAAFEQWIKDLTLEAYFAPQTISVPGNLDNESCSEVSNTVCGQQTNAERMLSNGDAPEGAWPWLVSIVQYGDHICSGVLIAERWVLCESKCFSSFPVYERDYSIYLGRSDELDMSQYEMSRSVKRVVHHPQNRFGTNRNYLALVELSPDVIYNDYIRPICLPTASVQFQANSSCCVTGWGQIKPPGHFPNSTARKELEVSVLEANQCSCLFEEGDSPNNQTVKRTLCAGSELGKACLEDYSMPLVCQKSTGSWLLAGLSSADTRCTEPYCPGIYTAAASFEPWIREIVTQEAQFVNLTGELPSGSTAGGPQSFSTTGWPQTSTMEGPLDITTEGPQSSSNTKGPQSVSTTVRPWTTNTAERPQSSTIGPLITIVTTGAQSPTLSRQPENSHVSAATSGAQDTRTTAGLPGISVSQRPPSGHDGDGLIEIVKPAITQPSAGSRAGPSVLLCCITGALYLISASW